MNSSAKIIELQKKISELPSGYISNKTINGKQYSYLQWKDSGKVKSKYIKANQLDYIVHQIEERKHLQAELEAELETELELTKLDNNNKASSRFKAYAHNRFMGQHVPIGVQSYEELISNKLFYIDKTDFISKWWNAKDEVTLITRPRRFGKTLNLRMMECFFSNKYSNRSDLFSSFKIWEDIGIRDIQGSFPVIFLTFGSIKLNSASGIITQLAKLISGTFFEYQYLEEQNLLTPTELRLFHKYQTCESPDELLDAIPFLCKTLHRIYDHNVIILLDEYDTPMLEAWTAGVWDECSNYVRNLMNSLFKSNPFLYRALLTGITRIGKESFFSDMNNIKVCALTSDDYATSFGFTEEEVFAAMDAQKLNDRSNVTAWYNGFTIGSHTDIYNPWSIINYLRSHEFKAYWVHSASNQLINSLFQPGDEQLKLTLCDILNGRHIFTKLREELTFNELSQHPESIWTLLLSSGYIKVVSVLENGIYELALTNREVHNMFNDLVHDWFSTSTSYNHFLEALLTDDVDFMIEYLNRISNEVFSYYDTSGNEPERFYHGLMLGMILDLRDRYYIRSNRESGLGRFDVILEPIEPNLYHAIILEYKIHRPRKEVSLKETSLNALLQIKDKNYEAELVARGISSDNIYKYGIAFKGKEIWIEGGLV